MWFIIWEKNAVLNAFHTQAALYAQQRAHSHREPCSGTLEKAADFCFRALLGTWVFLGLQALSAISAAAVCCSFWLTSLHALFPPPYYFLPRYNPEESSEHFALQAWGICRSCYETLLCERKKEACFLRQSKMLPNMFKIQWTLFLLWLQLCFSAKIKHRYYM